MKVDLHTHTLLSKKNGDSIKMPSIYFALEKIKDHKVKVVAFTDHNEFEAEFYLQAKKIADNFNILLLPGVEIDVVRKNDKRGNVIVIFSEQLSFEEYKQIERIIKFKTGKWKIRVSKINELFKDLEIIVIPHVGKSDYCNYEDLLDIHYDAIEITNFNHHNFKSFSKKMKRDNKSTSIVAFSDTHIWKSYPQNKKLFTSISNLKSFCDLKKALRERKNYVKEY